MIVRYDAKVLSALYASRIMIKFILKRILSGFFSFALFTAILFFGVNLLIPGDFSTTFIATEATRRSVRARLGLDADLIEQYLRWLGGILQGDLGQAFSIVGNGGRVTDLIMAELPATLLVFVIGSIVAFWLGLWLGVRTAWHVPKWVANSAVISSIAMYTAFPPWLAFMLGVVIIERWYNTFGFRIAQVGFHALAWNDSPYSIRQVMLIMVGVIVLLAIIALMLVRFVFHTTRRRIPVWLGLPLFILAMLTAWALLEIVPFGMEVVRVGFVPLVTFTMLSFGDTMLMMRSSMLDTKYETYILTARAKGISEREILRRHAAPNAILPVLSRLVINLPYLLTAVVIIERATDWRGVGDLLFDSIQNQNTNIYMGIMVFVALLTVSSRILLDVAYAYLDPRIRFGERTASW